MDIGVRGTPTALQRLVEEGRVTLPKRPKGLAPSPVEAASTISDLVTEQRR
jgi:hypothetical protein